MKGQEIFRFVCLRSPEHAEKAIQTEEVSSPLKIQLRASIANEEGGEALEGHAQTHLDGSTFHSDPSSMTHYDELIQFRDGLDPSTPLDPTALEAAATAIFGMSSSSFVASTSFQDLKAELLDGIIALRIATNRFPGLAAQYAELYQLLVLLELLAEEPASLAGMTYRAFRALHIVLPGDIFPLPEDLPEADDPASGGDPAEDPAALRAELQEIEGTVRELLSVHRADMEPDPVDPTGGSASAGPSPRAQMIDQYGSHSLVKAGTAARFQDNTTQVLNKFNLDPTAVPLAYVIDQLEQQAAHVGAKLGDANPAPQVKGLIQVGQTIFPGAYLDAPAVGGNGGNGGAHGIPSGGAGQVVAGPSLNASVAPSGIGSLMVTRQHILRYEAGEIAHIENVMKGETKERETRRLRRTEESLSREVETKKEEERDLQTTERMEMQREVENTLLDSKKWSIGGEVTAGFGPYFEVSINTEYATENVSETVARNASSYSKEVMEKTASRITERIREEQTIKTLQEFEEKNRHVLDGSGSADHIVGMFRWINRVYQGQVYDYGVRLFFDIMIPEPAKVLLYSKFKAATKASNSIVPPPELDIKASDLNENNYHDYLKTYQVRGVQPPPKSRISIGKTFSFSNPQNPQQGESGVRAESETLQIPEGYRATEVHVTLRGIDGYDSNVHPAKHRAFVGVGRVTYDFHNLEYLPTESQRRSSLMHGQEGTLPIVLLSEGMTGYVAQIEVLCLRNPRALEQWKIETYDAILEAYQIQRANYEEKMASRETDGISIEGRNPLENRRIERDELKRGAISIITKQQFASFNAYKTAVPVPSMDFVQAKTEGRYARFFEQAFEWENMTYELLPYYWANKKRWTETLLIEDPDPEHKAFLRSGFARLRVPVTPEFEAAVFHYLDTRKIWTEADVPKITNEKHLPFLEELAKRREEEAPVTEVPVGEPFQFTLPTTLVRVQDGDPLPEWTQSPDGHWEEVQN